MKMENVKVLRETGIIAKCVEVNCNKSMFSWEKGADKI